MKYQLSTRKNHHFMNKDMMMTQEMTMMQCMSMLSQCTGMMKNCMGMMMSMGMNAEMKMMENSMDSMNKCMSMIKEMGMADQGMNMMMDGMKMMANCMKMMMDAISGKMMSMKFADKDMMDMMMMDMDMMMKKMDMMSCMKMMQSCSMMMMKMELSMDKSSDMMMCMNMMKCCSMINKCMMMCCCCMSEMKSEMMPVMMDMNMAETGMNEIMMAEMEMPGLMNLRMEYSKMRPLAGMKIACCMHITVQTAVMMKTMMEMGAEVRCCAASTNSTQESAAAAMNMMGIPTFGMRGMSQDEMKMCMEMCMFMDAEMTMPVNMMMDTSGMMSKMMMEKHPMMMKNIMGVCMDSMMGMQMMNKMMNEGKLMMPVMNMNTSPRKAKIDYRYGSMESLVTSLRNLTGMMIAGKVCVVAGYGEMGKACADAMKMAGARVIVTEIDPFCALQACMDGCMVMKMDEACKMADIIITATENRDVIIDRHFKMMKNNCMVCNMSDYDSEIDMMYLNKAYGHTKVQMKPMVDMYNVEGKNIIVLGEGSSINMTGSMGYSSFVMSACFTIQTLAIMDFYLNSKMYENKIYKMPVGLGVKAAMMHLNQLGIQLDTLTPAQEACMKEMQAFMPEMMM